jgi:hypothetical protein
VDIREGYLERLPVHDESVDVVLSNGVVNLSPNKSQVFREIHACCAPVVALPRRCRGAAGAQVRSAQRSRLVGRLHRGRAAGARASSSRSPRAARADDRRASTVRNTSAAAKVSQDLLVHAVNFLAVKPTA